MFSSCLWTLNCKPVDSEIIPSSSASFHNTSLEAIVFYIFHPKKDRIVDKGRSISSVDWGKYAHMCSSDETVFKCLMPANVVIIYLAEANVSILRLNTLEEICIVTWVKLEQQNVVKEYAYYCDASWATTWVNPRHAITMVDQNDRKYPR